MFDRLFWAEVVIVEASALRDLEGVRSSSELSSLRWASAFSFFELPLPENVLEYCKEDVLGREGERRKGD